MKRTFFAVAMLTLVAGIGLAGMPSDVSAQTATCRSKCNDEEQACLKRTGNKSQCGNTANQCMAKCK